jgi:hypothetical protein
MLLNRHVIHYVNYAVLEPYGNTYMQLINKGIIYTNYKKYDVYRLNKLQCNYTTGGLEQAFLKSQFKQIDFAGF